MRFSFALGLFLLFAQFVAAQSPTPKDGELARRVQAVDEKVAANLDHCVKLYKHLHQNPELSLQEEQSAGLLAKELTALGMAVTEKVGKTGVVGVLKNGDGPTILIRTDMDALPIIEQTGLPYASKVTTRDRTGREVGVMHACGHDVHMACFTGTARVLTALRDRWNGTLVFVAQPAEEIGAGARLMLSDGLYKRFPKPDYCLALHCDANRAHGTVGAAIERFLDDVVWPVDPPS